MAKCRPYLSHSHIKLNRWGTQWRGCGVCDSQQSPIKGLFGRLGFCSCQRIRSRIVLPSEVDFQLLGDMISLRMGPSEAIKVAFIPLGGTDGEVAQPALDE